MIGSVSKGSAVQQRREEEKEQRKTEIIDATERVILQVGWNAVHFGAVAKEARLSRSLVYFYFKTKDELFHAVCARGMAELSRRFATVVSPNQTGLEHVLAIGRAYHAFSVECPLYFSLLSELQDRVSLPDEMGQSESQAHEKGKECLGRVAEALVRGRLDGSITTPLPDPAKASITIWAFTHGLIQIATRKAAMLERDFRLTSTQAMDDGFAMIRGFLTQAPTPLR